MVWCGMAHLTALHYIALHCSRHGLGLGLGFGGNFC